MKKMISFILSFVMLMEIGGYAHAAQNDDKQTTLSPQVCYSDNKQYKLKSRVIGNGTDYANSRGNIVVEGTLIENTEYRGMPMYLFSEEEPVTLSYKALSSMIEVKDWGVVADPGSNIDDISIGDQIKKGAIVVQKSVDGTSWNDTGFSRTNIFPYGGAINIDHFYSVSRSDLDKGMYFRIVIAYKLASTWEKNQNRFVTEIFTVYLRGIDQSEYDQRLQELEKLNDQNGLSIEGASIAGAVIGNQSTVNIVAGEEVFHASQGHGFAAESANMQAEAKKGSEVVHTGSSNIKDGADYIYKNGGGRFQVQTKYCKTAKHTINSCFDSKNDGMFRYYAEKNKPMLIEVPYDQFEECIELMEQKIKEGKVEGVTNPAKAREIIRQGTVTYKTASNLAKAGNIESLRFDAANSVVSCTSALGISATVRFATSIWNHDDLPTAIKNSMYTGLSVGGNAFITGVLAGQLAKAGLNSALVPATDAIIDFVGPKAAQVVVNASRIGVTPIYGAAAMKSASKILRGNVITGTITTVLFTVPDIVNAFRGRMSAKQVLKNAASTIGGIGGGIAGTAGGAAAGAAAGALIGSVVPGIGTLIGGAVGGLGAVLGGVGGAIAGSAGGKAIADLIAEDDADEMLKIVSEELQTIAEEYLVNSEEAEKIYAKLNDVIDAKKLKDMYAANDRKKFARYFLEPVVKDVISDRQEIVIPSDEMLAKQLVVTLEEIEEMDLAS